MKIIIAGGSGQVGQILRNYYSKDKSNTVINLSRLRKNSWVNWDGKSLGEWSQVIDGADLVINLAGRSVDCRYSKKNMQEMMDSRVDSTRVIGEAIARAEKPPPLWLQMSTATIYSHRFEQANDEATGELGGQETGIPYYWAYSVEIAKAWEAELNLANTPHTRRIAMRTAMVMSPSAKGVFDVLYRMTRLGLGGPIGGGNQFVSWIHDIDFIRAVEFVREHQELSGAINFCASGSLPQKEFMRLLRQAGGASFGLPAAAWMAEIGAFFLRTDTELLLKSRRVVPGRLLEAGFQFKFPDWETAAKDLTYRLSRRNKT